MIKGFECPFQFWPPGTVIQGGRQVQQNQGSAENTEAHDFPGIPDLAGAHDQRNRANNTQYSAEPVGGTVQPLFNAVMDVLCRGYRCCH